MENWPKGAQPISFSRQLGFPAPKLEELLAYPGIFDPDSPQAKKVLELHKQRDAVPDDAAGGFDPLVHGNPLAAIGLHPGDSDLASYPWGSEPRGAIFRSAMNMAFAAEMDWRIRFARLELDSHGAPSDIAPICTDLELTEWRYVFEDFDSAIFEHEQDGLDFVLQAYAPSGECWWFAKALSHWRAATRLEANETPQKVNWALIREYVLFGEAWERARVTLSFARAVLAGKKSSKGASDGGKMRAVALQQKKQDRLQAMRRLMEDGKNASQAARILAKRGGFGTANAIRRAWTRHNAES